MKKAITILIAILFALPLFAQDAGLLPDSSSGFQAGINLGSDVLPTGTGGALESWTHLGFTPDFAIGKFGIGLDLSIRFQLYSSSTQPFRIYEGDWIPPAGKTVFDLYLPKILYVRYGLRGIDPLYVKLGSIKDFTLGNGFVVGDYSNMRFLPETRMFGAQLGIDGSLFGFPYAGVELLTGNLARFDVMGGRFYLRPLAGTGIPILKAMQLGVTGVVDIDPYLYNMPDGAPAGSPVMVLGGDVTAPLISGSIFSLTAHVDGAYEPNTSMGFSTGVGGRLIGVFTYDAGLRFLQKGFIPTYFDENYDIYRANRYIVMKTVVPGDFVPGWLAGLGTSLFKDKLFFKVTLDGPFSPIPATSTDLQADYPHGKAVLGLGEGVIPNISFRASYEKYFIGRKTTFMADLVDPTDAMVGLAVSYRIGAAVLTLQYDAVWNPTTSAFDIHSSLFTSVKF